MAKKKSLKPVSDQDLKKIGHYAFFGGIVLAILIELLGVLKGPVALGALVGLGILVGLLNVTSKETSGFLVATIVLIISFSTTYSAVGSIPEIGIMLSKIWNNMILFVSFAAIVVALKTVYMLAQD